MTKLLIDELAEACRAAAPIIKADIQIAFVGGYATDGKREHADRLLEAALARYDRERTDSGEDQKWLNDFIFFLDGCVQLKQKPAFDLAGLRDHLIKFADRLTALAARVQELEALLQRISEWDHMDTAADGAYWRSEIRAALGKEGV